LPYPAEPDEWLSHAKEEKGSWWPSWSGWLERHAGGKRKAPAKPGNAKYKALEPAPGRYVRQRIH
jgi:polyhydroxyalkanoate synthase